MAIDKEALKTLSVGERIKVLRGEQSQEQLKKIADKIATALEQTVYFYFGGVL